MLPVPVCAQIPVVEPPLTVPDITTQQALIQTDADGITATTGSLLMDMDKVDVLFGQTLLPLAVSAKLTNPLLMSVTDIR
jgi:hypothetical protein